MAEPTGWLVRAKSTIAQQLTRAQPVATHSMAAEATMLTTPEPTNGRNQRSVQTNPWGGPGRPYMPTAPLEQPLVFEYMPGINLIAQPRVGFDLTPFSQLRSLADLCQEIRLPIELLKREVRALEWDIAQRKGIKRDLSGQINEARERLSKPDGEIPLDVWVNMLLEEVLVIDAATLYPRSTRGGDLLALEIIDGATVRPLLDDRGRVPDPPVPGYIQTIRGLPVGQWSKEQLWYLPYNPSVRSPYGRPPVELILLIVNLALRRSVFHIGYYTEGNIPEALVGLPSDWDVEQIEAFQSYWDALLAGDVEKLRRIKFLPTSGGDKGGGGLHVHEFRRPDSDTRLDEWLLRVGCWAVGVSPMEFGIVPAAGLGGKGFSEGQSDIQYRMGLGPLAQYLKGIFDRVLAVWGYSDLEYKWTSLQPSEDKLQQAQVDQIYVTAGIRSREAVREERGWADEPLPEAPVAQEREEQGFRPPFFRSESFWAGYP